MRPAAVAPCLGALLAAGCATTTDLVQHERRLTVILQNQERAIEQVSAEVARLSTDAGPRRNKSAVPSPPPSPPPDPSAAETVRAEKLEGRVREIETKRAASRPIGMTLSPEGTSTEDPSATEQTMTRLAARAAAPTPAAVGAAPAGPPVAGASRMAALPVPPGDTPLGRAPQVAVDADWRREVAQDRAVAGMTGGARSGAYLHALDSLGSGDCSTARTDLGALAADTGASQVLDNVLYWKARCAALQGDSAQAVSSLRTLVSRYPRSDKAPAALWQESRLLIRLGDIPGARVALTSLVHDYPSTSEATQARRKLDELGR